MNEREFLDLLRYYFRKVKPEDVEEILSDYKAHFTEARERGLSDAQIAAELGHPEDIYASYQSEGIVSEKTKMEKILRGFNGASFNHLYLKKKKKLSKK